MQNLDIKLETFWNWKIILFIMYLSTKTFGVLIDDSIFVRFESKVSVYKLSDAGLIAKELNDVNHIAFSSIEGISHRVFITEKDNLKNDFLGAKFRESLINFFIPLMALISYLAQAHEARNSYKKALLWLRVGFGVAIGFLFLGFIDHFALRSVLFAETLKNIPTITGYAYPESLIHFFVQCGAAGVFAYMESKTRKKIQSAQIVQASPLT